MKEDINSFDELIIKQNTSQKIYWQLDKINVKRQR